MHWINFTGALAEPNQQQKSGMASAAFLVSSADATALVSAVFAVANEPLGGPIVASATAATQPPAALVQLYSVLSPTVAGVVTDVAVVPAATAASAPFASFGGASRVRAAPLLVIASAPGDPADGGEGGGMRLSVVLPTAPLSGNPAGPVGAPVIAASWAIWGIDCLVPQPTANHGPPLHPHGPHVVVHGLLVTLSGPAVLPLSRCRLDQSWASLVGATAAPSTGPAGPIAPMPSVIEGFERVSDARPLQVELFARTLTAKLS